MGRKKTVSGSDVKVKESYSLKASFYVVDKIENVRTVKTFESKGDTVTELLANIDFPSGCNRPVLINVSRGANEIERKVAPHKARWILEDKDEAEFEKVFRGL